MIGARVGAIPYGYRLTKDGKKLCKDEGEQTVLANIKRLRAKGYTLQAIADTLNKEGVYTRRGSEWRHQYIHSLLRMALNG